MLVHIFCQGPGCLSQHMPFLIYIEVYVFCSDPDSFRNASHTPHQKNRKKKLQTKHQTPKSTKMHTQKEETPKETHIAAHKSNKHPENKQTSIKPSKHQINTTNSTNTKHQAKQKRQKKTTNPVAKSFWSSACIR